jgi:hypothetical protein
MADLDARVREIEAQGRSMAAHALAEQEEQRRVLELYLTQERQLVSDFLARIGQPTERILLAEKGRWHGRSIVRDGWVLEENTHGFSEGPTRVSVTSAGTLLSNSHELTSEEARSYGLSAGAASPSALAYNRGFMFRLDKLALQLETALAYRLVHGEPWGGPSTSDRIAIGNSLESTIDRTGDCRPIRAR